MKESDVSTPLIEKYTEILESNPKSRVFAPLAEAYRKLGMVKQALKILQQGIRYNPDYVLGHLGIAHCYFDSGEYVLAYNTLRPLIIGNRDNILLQRLYSDVCLKIGHKEEALETFKFLLFINSRDEYAAKMVKELEDNIFPSPAGRPEFVINEQPAEEELFDVKNIRTANNIDELDEWVEVKLSPEEVVSSNKVTSNNFDDWSVQKEVKEDFSSAEEEDDFIFENEVEKEASGTHSPSMFTQTLVNLYCSQGHFTKARDILEKILELNPNDEKAKEKIVEIDGLLSPEHLDEAPRKTSLHNENEGEDAGRKNLMDFFDTRIKDFEEVEEEDFEIESSSDVIEMIKGEETSESDHAVDQLEEKLWAFHSLLKQRAQESMMRF